VDILAGYVRCNNSGSLAIFAAIRRASSRLKSFAAERLAIDISERLRFSNDEASLRLFDGPRRRKAAGFRLQYSPRVTAVLLRFLIQRGEPQSSSASRFTAGAFIERSRFDTMPSQPSLQASNS
jgi:hypothetical protein